MTSLVFDVGGTTIRAGVYDGGLRRCVRAPAPSFLLHPSDGGPALVERLIDSMQGMARELQIAPERVGVGFCGPVDEGGRVWRAPTLWGERVRGPLALGSYLEAAFPGAQVRVLNDVSAAGYRYLRSEEESLCVVTVSSGIGHKLFLRGRPVVGPAGRGGEIGHWRADSSEAAPVCDCGGRGHLGALGSGRAVPWQVARLAREDPAGLCASSLFGWGESTTPEQLVAHLDDPFAGRVLAAMAAPLGQALSAIHLDTGVERFVLMGGFALAAGERYRAAVAGAARECGWEVGADWDAMVELGEPDDDAGLVGLGRFFERFS